MKFINPLALLLLTALVSGCASLNFGSDTPVSGDSAAAKSPDSTAQTEPAIEPEVVLTPLQQKAADLRARPNLYLANPVAVPQTLRTLYSRAIEAKQQGELDKAEVMLNQITEQAPNLSGPWLHLGDIAVAKTDPQDDSKDGKQARETAIKLYQRAIEANPYNYFAHNRLAVQFRDAGLFNQAQRHYQQAIDSWPGYATAYLNLGILYDLYLNNKRQALIQYETYQLLQDEPERKVSGWIADLSRQLQQSQSNQGEGQ